MVDRDYASPDAMADYLDAVVDAVRAHFGYSALDDLRTVLDLATASGACDAFHQVLVRSAPFKGGYAMAGEGLCDVLRKG
mmetsp:Transcript_26428/g.79680  ORF Transcript_26428/g.79680 Transcript_26428/m.79680 type:complete len:80 (+) Transcript_26428:1053-1292(+)